LSVTGSEGCNVSWDERITDTSKELLL
jgi:hypothetical protein